MNLLFALLFRLDSIVFLSLKVWRIIVGLSLIPAFGTLYYRLTLPESKRYIKARRIAEGLDSQETTMDENLKKDDASHHSKFQWSINYARKLSSLQIALARL